MKKLAYTLILISVIALSSCRSNNYSAITRGIKTLSKCCTALSVTPSQSMETLLEENEDLNDKTKINTVSYLPVDSWDSKMMFW